MLPALVAAAAVATTSLAAPPNPWAAAAWSALAFPAVALTTGATLGALSGSPLQQPLYVLWGASPLLMGAGQLYAGDASRAMWVGLGGPVAVVGGALAGAAVAVPLSAWLNPSDRQAALGG